MGRIALIALLVVSLSACAAYHTEPLPREPELTATAPSSAMGLGAVAKFAVAHSPELLARRRRTEVNAAQAFEGGLLPDPQFSASVDHPTVHGPGLVNGYALGLAQDLQAVLIEPSRANAAAAKERQAKLDLLWAEWQTIQKSATLFVEKLYTDQKLAVLQHVSSVLETQTKHSMHELQRHNTTIDVAGADLSAELDILSQRDAAARGAIAADSDLKALLGLAPDASLALVDPGDPMPIRRDEVTAALKQVVNARPDLLALQAGYHAQNEAVRTAILEQFPAINVGFNRASDTSNIQTSGLSVTLNIPIFGSTQAKIRVEEATRAQLRAEYSARLDQTAADAWRIWQGLILLRQQVDVLARSVPKLQKMAETGRAAFVAGNIAPATYVFLETTLSARENELFDLRATLWKDTIALRTLLAMTPLLPRDSHAH